MTLPPASPKAAVVSADARARAAVFRRVHLVTYGSGAFARSVKRLVSDARRFGFSKIHVYRPEMLPRDFIRAHQKFLVQSRRGDGYWLWKSYIVQDVLSRLPDGAMLFYADAGCAINVDAQARFYEWVDLCDARDVISFEMVKETLLEKYWTKMSVAEFMNCTAPQYLETGQIAAGIFGIKKTPRTVDLVRRWHDICCLEWTIDNSVQPPKNDEGFREHRHDQSVFSLLLKQAGFASLRDETFPEDEDWANPAMAHVPIVARRRKEKREGVLRWLTPKTTLVDLARRSKNKR